MWRALKPNLHSMADSMNHVMPLLAQGEAWMSFGHSRIAGSWLIRGAPVARAPVKEGPFMGLNCVTLVKGGPHPDVGKKLIDRLLSAEVQADLAAKATTGPTNRNVKLAPDVARWVPYGPEDVKEMHTAMDWNYINSKRAEWTDRWNKEVAV
jgi:putative spermidine/putrescine transport system substrate-binding protein